jgi:hypothetical protein
MTDPLDQVLRLVAEGRLTAEEAEPILEALEAAQRPAADERPPSDAGAGPGAPPRFARLEITEAGRSVVNMRIPIALGLQALSSIPGLSPDQTASIRDAVNAGTRGAILDVRDPDGDGTRIVLE